MADEWRVVSPVEDLDLETSLAIADVRFYRLTAHELAQWNCFKKLEERGLGKFCDNFKNHICAEVEVQAPNKDSAFKEASFRIKNSLNTLRIFKDMCELREPLGAVMKNKKSGKEEFSWFKAKWTQVSAWPWKCRIESKDQTNLSNLVSILEPFLRNPDSCELNRKIIRSLRWSAEASQEIEEADRILKCVTALECLLLKEWTNKANLLAERIAVIWTSDTSKRNKIFADIKGFYELRNCILHGEKYEITKGDLTTLDWVSRNLVPMVARIANKNSYTAVQDMITFVDQRRGGWNPPTVKRRPC